MSKSATDWIKLMLSTGEYADVHFLVGDGDEKKLIPAHQLILKNASDVFEAMFRFDSKNAKAENASANCPVEVPDVEPTAFKVMLSFIYTDDLSGLSGHNAMAVLYVAKKYNIPGLVGPALRIPVWKLRNVFLGFTQARLFGLENYAKDCLDYIDKNVETLVKSKSFLEIDQKLLCELLERDQLQIRGEISVWEACHQNGINCSAENRRQMLGPVLFKIRFQFLSKDAFSKKIVPSNVLTAEEVISVEKYHNHLSDDILYPLQFLNRNRCSSFETLLMDIEKMRNFSLEPFGSRRYSETLSKKGMLWKMETAINRTRSDHGTDNNDKKCLSLYLLCAPSTAEVFTNSNKGWGFPSFITLAELMDPSNGFYDKDEDKVTLAIHFIVNPNQETGRKFQSLLDPK
ncbi:hypothetical protein niasHS_017171 [Heterodera schachtii]|uniref:BTB domain-containing protein n=1 Tax=Heterodera schachtii TaxID=97005 RepID=A0ABD2HZ72_HETSC